MRKPPLASRRTKLSVEQVVAIRRSSPSVSNYKLAKIYGISQKAVANARSGKTWRSVS